MRFQTQSGTIYRYHRYTNRIDLASNGTTPEEETVHFLPVPVVDSLLNMSTFIVELTQGCNLRCSYCCYSGDYIHNHPHREGKTISVNRLNDIYDFIEKHRAPGRPISICYYGGEPFTKIELLKQAIEVAKSRFDDETQYTISTNLTCLTEDIAHWCIKQRITLNVSLDGVKCVHDKHRVYKNGRGSYDVVYKNLTLLESLSREYFDENINLLVTFTELKDLIIMAQSWGEDVLLRGKAPYLISGVASNYPNVSLVDEREVENVLYRLMDYYEHHRNNLFAKTYFDQLTAPILDRDVYKQEDSISSLVCLPYNQRCFIDTDLCVGICEKTSDDLRIGTVKSLDYNKINELISLFSRKKQEYCASCEIQRLCQMCFTNYHLTSSDWDTYCKRQRSWSKISMQMTCEMAERELYDSDEAKICLLRPLSRKDAPALLHWMSNPKVVQHIVGLEAFESLFDAKRFLKLFDRTEKNVPSLMYGIEHTSAGLIGIVGFDQIDYPESKNKIVSKPDANILFILDEQYWHKGIMTSMLSQFLSFKVSQAHLNVHPVLRISEDNENALHLAERFAECRAFIENELEEF